jgi:hypothetical protein
MEHRQIERIAGYEPGTYAKDPEGVYLAFQFAVGTCLIDQWIPTNPLKMGDHGYEGDAAGRTATTGADEVVVDGMAIRSPEDVAEHLERFAFPRLREQARSFDAAPAAAKIIERERAIQDLFGGGILKSGYGFVSFPGFAYGRYGYENYFGAYALYPDLMERHFSLQADLALLQNRAAAKAYLDGDLPPMYRLDHDMASSQGTLVDIRSLDRIWFPHFARCLEPVLKAGVRPLWHCDGNLMAMVPRLIAAGVHGFQGFQYEDGMDYEKICRMKTPDGEDLLIEAGVSVTRTLPFGRSDDVRREMEWLVRNGPKTGLFLAASSSITPGVPLENLEAFIDGLAHFRRHGRDGP